jgi:undecaprenyl-diphosphatase
MKVRNVLVGTALVGAALRVGRWSSGREGREVDAELFGEGNRDRGPGPDRFFTGVTELGSIWAAGAAAGVLALSGRRRAAAKGFAAAGAAWLVGQGLKRVANRPRPYQADPDGARVLIVPPPASSWPSSHPMVLAAFTSVAGRDLGLGVTAKAALTGLGVSVAASRVYVGVHYPSDVVSGLLIGRAIGRVWPRRS